MVFIARTSFVLLVETGTRGRFYTELAVLLGGSPFCEVQLLVRRLLDDEFVETWERKVGACIDLVSSYDAIFLLRLELTLAKPGWHREAINVLIDLAASVLHFNKACCLWRLCTLLLGSWYTVATAWGECRSIGCGEGKILLMNH